MIKVVKNDCYGGFQLSPLAVMEYAKLKGIELFAYDMDYNRLYTLEEMQKAFLVVYFTKEFDGNRYRNESFFNERKIQRDDPYLVEVVETLGGKANGRCSNLVVVEIPDGVQWEITEYDGLESIEEIHRRW